MKNLQQNGNKKLQHLLSIKELDKNIIEQIFVDADRFLEKKDTKFAKCFSKEGFFCTDGKGLTFTKGVYSILPLVSAII